MSIDELINLAMQEEYGKTQHSGAWEELHIPTLKHGIELTITEAYKKGHIDGAIEVVNNTCDICGSYPMTTNCNNAGCDV